MVVRVSVCVGVCGECVWCVLCLCVVCVRCVHEGRVCVCTDFIQRLAGDLRSTLGAWFFLVCHIKDPVTANK